MTSAIELLRVSKNYGKTRVLDDVSFDCPEGSIVAFVGPNGAGKSTTLRIICRLSSATEGEVRLGSVDVSDVRDPGHVFGSVLDPSAHHPGRTVFSTIRIPAAMLGIPVSRVKELIDQLGLGTVSKRRFHALSLGMKQRVSLAIALLANPRVLILDEPMNGLDVDGIKWLRTLLRQFANQGGTVVISSHLLNELQMIADRVVIISKGQIVAQEDLGTADDSRCEAVPEDAHAFSQLLASHNIMFSDSDGRITVQASRDSVAKLAFEHRILLLAIQTLDSPQSIEQSYQSVTEGEFSMSFKGLEDA